MKKIILENVSKSFKGQTIFEDVNLEFTSNKIIGIVGENGSGKTVLMKLLVGLMKPSEGEIQIDENILGSDIDFPESVGVIIDKPVFLNEYSGIKNLMILKDIKNIIDENKVKETFRLVGLKDEQKKVQNYSMGMKQRLAIAQAIMEEPELLVLDEFSNGLDKKGIELIHQILLAYKNEERIIIISSHNQYDINNLCDEIYEVLDNKVTKIK